MSTSPASGLSAEAKEFVPISSPSTTTTTVPLYVDENTVASLYPSDHQPLMVQTIYPMMLTNSKGTDNMQFPEIEFHIQPSQQQAQFHIDSQASPVTNGNSSTTTSQIVLLPTTNSVSGFYPTPQILYSPNEPISGYYPMDYCEPSLINFSLQQSNLSTKSNRILSQHSTRGNTFRQQHGAYRSTSRANHRGGGNSIRNSYYDYSNRRNGSSGRGNSLVNKRISSSYHSHDYNNYYHSSSSSRSRGGGGGYSSRSTQNHDDYRKDQYDYYNSEKDSYDNDYHQTSQMNDDGTPFEFRPEDFPSLPNNPSQQSDKSPPTVSTNPKPASSWNTIVSSNPPRPHSTSPHSLAPTQDSRSDRSRSFNTKSSTKKSAHQPLPPPASQPNNRASKNEDHSQQHLINKTDLPKDDNIDDGFIQTKQQHRRLKRRHKIKEEPVPFSLNDEQTLTNIQIENDHQSKTSLPETFNSLNISSSENIEKTDTNITENNSNHSSSSSSNSSDTSDYDDAVDNFDAE